MFGPEADDAAAPVLLPVHRAVAEVDLWFPQAKGGPRWIEWGGCGMVNPRVLRAAASTPSATPASRSAWASSARCMFRHGVTDMRDMVEGDVRFTLPFGMEV